jgi:hypothetical protein
VPFCVRLGTLPWNRHPYFARRESIDYMASVDLSRAPRHIRAVFPRSTQEAYSEHMARRHPTWAGDLTVGEYVKPLKAVATSGLTELEAERLRYAYHHGGVVEQSYLDSVSSMAEGLKALGCPVVAYRTPVPVQRGSEFFGEPFRELAEHNFEQMEKAYRGVLGAGATVLQTGTISGSDEFLDPTDASEHLNQRGRLRVAEHIVQAVTAELRATSSTR